MSTMWMIFGLVSVIILIIFWKNKNAVWGGLIAGFIVGSIIALVYLFKGIGFDWYWLGKGCTVGVTIGAVAELLGMIGEKISKERL